MFIDKFSCCEAISFIRIVTDYPGQSRLGDRKQGLPISNRRMIL